MTTPLAPAPEGGVLLREYRARLIAVHALLCDPVTDKNINDARELIAPLFQDALRDTKALRKATRLTDRIDPSPHADGCFEATAGEQSAASLEQQSHG